MPAGKKVRKGGNAAALGAEGSGAGMRRAMEALELNKRILNTSSVGILAYKASGKCVFANRVAGEIVGTSAKKLMEQDFHRIKSWKKSGMYGAALKALKTGAEQCLDSHIFTSFGKEVWLRNRFSSFISGGESHLLLFISDISTLKSSERMLREEKDKYRSLFENTANCIAIYGAIGGERTLS